VIVVRHLAEILAFALLCHGVGRWLVRRLPSPSPFVTTAIATGLGYGILSMALFFLANAGVLTRTSVIALFIVASIVSLVMVPYARVHPWILIAAIPSFVLALYPPTAYDATTYHLMYAKHFAEQGRLVFDEALRFPTFPFLGEMPFAAALLLADDLTAQLTQWLCMIVTAAAIPALFPDEWRKASPLAIALWLGTPYAVYLGASATIDCTLAMCVTLAFASWMLWKRTDHAGWLALAGAFAGMSAATKYFGLVFGVMFAIALLRSRRKLLLFAMAAAIFAVPMYVHNFFVTGNPIHPFGDPLYQLSLLDMAPPLADPFTMVVRQAWLAPIQHGMPPHSPWIIALVPLTIAAWFLARSLRFPLIASAIFIAAAAWHDGRYALTVIPIIATAIAIAVNTIPYRRTLIVLFALPGIAWGTLLIAKFGAIPGNRDAFLDARIPILRAIDTAGATTTYVFRAPQAAYYCPGRCLGDYNGPYRYAEVQPLLTDSSALAMKLRSFGATHIVVNDASVTLPFAIVYRDETATTYAVPQ
jgi:hypothetical protein